MAGREDNDKGYALRFLETFRKLRRTYSGIGLSIHGGEVDSPGSQVRDTLLTFSFAEPAVKNRLLREYEAAVSQFEKTVKVRTSGYATRTFGLTLR